MSDARVLALIRRYAAPDVRGWVMEPTDMYYRLTRWHGVEITREQLAAVLGTAQYNGQPLTPP